MIGLGTPLLGASMNTNNTTCMNINSPMWVSPSLGLGPPSHHQPTYMQTPPYVQTSSWSYQTPGLQQTHVRTGYKSGEVGTGISASHCVETCYDIEAMRYDVRFCVSFHGGSGGDFTFRVYRETSPNHQSSILGSIESVIAESKLSSPAEYLLSICEGLRHKGFTVSDTLIENITIAVVLEGV